MPACPGGAVVRQPDGAEITVILRGDERLHWNEDGNGYAVARSPENPKLWVYAREVDGIITPTRHVVGRVDPRAIGLRKPDIKRMAAVRSSAYRTTTAEPQPALVPPTGTMQNLVILVNFSDLAIQYTRQQFDDLFNQIGYTGSEDPATQGAVGSVKDYYLEVSRNQLTVQSTVVEPVTLDNGYAYYGANDASGDDVRPQQMVVEALNKLNARGFDFTTVDGDGDGWIDGLTVIHAGGGEEYSGNDPNYIWSHKWSIWKPGFRYYKYDGIIVYDYHTEPARRGWDSGTDQGITRVGVICHETGHFLGLPDLYDYGYDSEGVGNFCLMAGGSWNGYYGTRPAHMSAWCKTDIGWVTPTVISSGGGYSISQVVTGGEIFKLRGNFQSNEYFLVENRQGVGFDASLPGSSRGLLIWHVDENKANNDDQTHYKVDLEEASGAQDLQNNTNSGNDADYFRYGNATRFGQTTAPNNYSYSGTWLGMNITSVSVTGSTMTFYVDNGTVATPIFAPNGGTFDSPQNVTISCPMTDAVIHYTTNGIDPTESDPAIASGDSVAVGSSLTLKARAFLAGWTPSTVKSAAFTINLTPPIDVARITDLRSIADGERIRITDAKTATSAWNTFTDGVSNYFYIEEPDRSTGIKVIADPSEPVTLWENVTLTGMLGTDSNGERTITVESIDSRSAGAPIGALGMIGGTIVSGVAPETTGLLVRVWGLVTLRAADDSYIVIDDGSEIGLKVLLTGQTAPPSPVPDESQYVAATGISGLLEAGAGQERVVRPRTSEDIAVY